MGRKRIHDSEQARRIAQNMRRMQARKVSVPRFTGIDGEGVTQGLEHRYVLLGCGSKQIKDGDGLRFPDIAEFLYSCFLEDKEAVYAGFFLGYDFTQWLRSLPAERAWRLLSDEGIASRSRRRSGDNNRPFPVKYAGWEFDMLAMKRFKLRREGSREWMYINDAGSFFQCSFLNAIDPKDWQDPVVSADEYETLQRGKFNRSTARLDSNMAEYNALENSVFSRLMSRLAGGFAAAGLRLSRDQWYGPGQAAQAWLNGLDIKPSAKRLAEIPGLPEILDIARKTYYGGWFEIFCHGHIPGTSWEYDINSAYPAIIAGLPCLEHGRWIHNRPVPESRYRFVHATVQGSDKHIGAMLHRMPDGSIRRPYRTTGWYWQSELDAAVRAGLIDTIDVIDSWDYDACACRAPFRGIAGMYEERQRIGKKSSQGKAYKLVYNSVYGKFAQSVGSPRFGNSVYASLITSGCRTMILDAIATHPRRSAAVVMIATDGIYFTEPHPGLTISERMGEWDATERHNLTLFKPGIYWDDDTRQRIADGQAPAFKSRGVSAAVFAQRIREIDNHYRRWPGHYPYERDPMGDREGWHPRVILDTAFAMTTAVQAVAYGRWDKAGTIGHQPIPDVCDGCPGNHVIQDADPVSKRHSGWYENGIYWSRPYADGGLHLESTDYDKRFGQPDPDEYGITEDGSVLDSFAWMLRG